MDRIGELAIPLESRPADIASGSHTYCVTNAMRSPFGLIAILETR
jgi:hypothetical protein